MVACAKGGAAVACAEFESGSASKTSSKAALGAHVGAACQLTTTESAAGHEPPHTVVMCAG